MNYGTQNREARIGRVQLVFFLNKGMFFFLNKGRERIWGTHVAEHLAFPAKKNLGIQVYGKLDMNQQYFFAVHKAKCIPDCIKRCIASRVREEILLLCSVM